MLWSCTVSSGGAHLHHISLPPAHPPSPLYVSSSLKNIHHHPGAEQTEAVGHHSYGPRSPIVSTAIPQFIPLWTEPVFLTAGNNGRCQNPLLVFAKLERCYRLVCSVSLKARPHASSSTACSRSLSNTTRAACTLYWNARDISQKRGTTRAYH